MAPIRSDMRTDDIHVTELEAEPSAPRCVGAIGASLETTAATYFERGARRCLQNKREVKATFPSESPAAVVPQTRLKPELTFCYKVSHYGRTTPRVRRCVTE